MALPRIPKLTKKKDILSWANRHELVEVETVVKNSCLFPGKYWTIEYVQMINNPKLSNQYRHRKKEIREEMGVKIIADTFMFMCSTDTKNLVTEGVSVDPDNLSLLGDANMGIHVYRWADVCLESERLKQRACHLSLVLLKVVVGKSKPVGTNATPALEPTPNYHSHVPLEQAKPTDPFVDAQAKSQVYLYQYNEDMLPDSKPKQCLPYAVVTLNYNGPQPVNSYNRLPAKVSSHRNNNQITLLSPMCKLSPNKREPKGENGLSKETNIKGIKRVLDKSEGKDNLRGSSYKFMSPRSGLLSPTSVSSDGSEDPSAPNANAKPSPVMKLNQTISSKRDPRLMKSLDTRKLLKSGTVLNGIKRIQTNDSVKLSSSTTVNRTTKEKIKLHLLHEAEKGDIRSETNKPKIDNLPKQSDVNSVKTVSTSSPKIKWVSKKSIVSDTSRPETDHIQTKKNIKSSNTVAERLKEMLLNLPKDVFSPDTSSKDPEKFQEKMIRFSANKTDIESTEDCIFEKNMESGLAKKMLKPKMSLSHNTVMSKDNTVKSVIGNNKQSERPIKGDGTLETDSLIIDKESDSPIMDKKSHIKNDPVEKPLRKSKNSLLNVQEKAAETHINIKLINSINEIEDIQNSDHLVHNKPDKTNSVEQNKEDKNGHIIQNKQDKKHHLKQNQHNKNDSLPKNNDKTDHLIANQLEKNKKEAEQITDLLADTDDLLASIFLPQKVTNNNDENVFRTSDSNRQDNDQCKELLNSAELEKRPFLQTNHDKKNGTSISVHRQDEVIYSVNPASPEMSSSTKSTDKASYICLDSPPYSSEDMMPSHITKTTNIENYQKPTVSFLSSLPESPSLAKSLENDDDDGMSIESFHFDFDREDGLSGEVLSCEKNSTNTGINVVTYIDSDSDDDCFIVDSSCFSDKNLESYHAISEGSISQSQSGISEGTINKSNISALTEPTNSTHRLNPDLNSSCISSDSSGTSKILSDDVLDLTCTSDGEGDINEKTVSNTPIKQVQQDVIVLDFSDSENNNNNNNSISSEDDINVNNIEVPVKDCDDQLSVCISRQLSTAFSNVSLERKRTYSYNSDTSTVENDNLIKRRKIQEELRKTCQLLREKSSFENIKEAELFHTAASVSCLTDVEHENSNEFTLLDSGTNGPKESTNNDLQHQVTDNTKSEEGNDMVNVKNQISFDCNSVSDKKGNTEILSIHKGKSCENVNYEESDKVCKITKANSDIVKPRNFANNETLVTSEKKFEQVTSCKRKLCGNVNNEENSKLLKTSHTPCESFYTKYAFPPMLYTRRPLRNNFTKELFQEFDQKICKLHKRFNKYYKKLKKLASVLKTNDKNSVAYKNAYKEYRKEEVIVAKLHIAIEVNLTYFEVVSNPSKIQQSTWQTKCMENLHQQLKCVQEGNSKVALNEKQQQQLVTSLQQEIEKVKSFLLVPPLPKDSPGNKVKLLSNLLQDTESQPEVVLLKKKVTELLKMKGDLRKEKC